MWPLFPSRLLLPGPWAGLKDFRSRVSPRIPSSKAGASGQAQKFCPFDGLAHPPLGVARPFQTRLLMSKPSRSGPAGASDEEQAPDAVFSTEEIFVTRLEVEANTTFDPDARTVAPAIRRLLRVGEDRGAERLWYIDFELASGSDSSPYRYTVHLFATVTESSTQLDRDIAATEVAAKLLPRLFMIAGEQLFAATVRGPWGPISIPAELAPTKVRPVTKEVASAFSRLTAILEAEGPMPKASLAAKVGDQFEPALSFALVQGLVEENAGQVLLRRVLGEDEQGAN